MKTTIYFLNGNEKYDSLDVEMTKERAEFILKLNDCNAITLSFDSYKLIKDFLLKELNDLVKEVEKFN